MYNCELNRYKWANSTLGISNPKTPLEMINVPANNCAPNKRQHLGVAKKGNRY